MKSAALIAALWLGGADVGVDPQGWLPDAVFSQVSAGASTDAWSIGGQWRWNRAWTVRDSLLLRGRWEISVGRWRTDADDGGGDRAWVTQVSVLPTLRLTSPGEHGWYAELGSGPSFLMPVFRSRDREFSTEFNFQSHFAVGYVLGWGGKHDVGLRVEHFSNAGIREPNPGMNFASLRYTHRFGADSRRPWFAGADAR